MSSGSAPSYSVSYSYHGRPWFGPEPNTPYVQLFVTGPTGGVGYIRDVSDGPSDDLAVLQPGEQVIISATIGGDGQELIYAGSNPEAGDVLFQSGSGTYTVRSKLEYADLSVIPWRPGPLVLCFASGTRILTARGEVEVEGVRPGDVAITASGARRPITWIGHRQLGVAQPMAADQAPVRVRAGAFGEGLPCRDLLLSPGHPVLVGADAGNEGGVLVPVMCLINGTTIARTGQWAVTYWHIELDAHDILLAEGLPAESYIDLGSRPWFSGSDAPLHDPDLAAAEAPGRCRPVAVRGPVVEAERARLDAVFAESLSEQCRWNAGPVWDAP